MAQLKKVESNDTGKSDHKDLRVMRDNGWIHQLCGPTRQGPAAPPLARVRQRIHAPIGALFPDYDKSAAFTFGATGTALRDAYAFNPFHIVRAGYKRFERALKRRSKYTPFQTLRCLFARAELSARYPFTAAEIDLLTSRLRVLWTHYQRHSKCMQHLQKEIEALGETLKTQGALPCLDEDVAGVTLFNMARLVGETGPLGDFPSKQALLRYAGLNIRERKSGQYRGHNRISKKGRPVLRKVLCGSPMIHQMTFPLLRRPHLYGAYYHAKVERGMPRQKAKVAVMRKFLSMVYALTQSGERFQTERFRRCQSQYHRRAGRAAA